jgi:hypothetical protein
MAVPEDEEHSLSTTPRIPGTVTEAHEGWLSSSGWTAPEKVDPIARTFGA